MFLLWNTSENEYRLNDTDFIQETLQMIQDTFSCDVLTAKNYLSLALPAENIDDIIETNEEQFSDNGEMIASIDREIDTILFRRIADSKIASLNNKREADILCKRVGWRSEEMTLEEIGAEYRLTRERIRQIEKKALRRIHHPTRTKELRGFLYLLYE